MLLDSNYTENLHLQKAICLKRTKMITNVAYDLKLNLPRGEFYSGKIEVFF